MPRILAAAMYYSRAVFIGSDLPIVQLHLRAATIGGQHLIKEIRYAKSNLSEKNLTL